jgi:hypothetical protein
MVWTIVFHHEFTDWVRTLGKDDQDRINEALEVLRTADLKSILESSKENYEQED